LGEQISQGKRFTVSWKVGENEFCRVVGTMKAMNSSHMTDLDIT